MPLSLPFVSFPVFLVECFQRQIFKKIIIIIIIIIIIKKKKKIYVIIDCLLWALPPFRTVSSPRPGVRASPLLSWRCERCSVNMQTDKIESWAKEGIHRCVSSFFYHLKGLVELVLAFAEVFVGRPQSVTQSFVLHLTLLPQLGNEIDKDNQKKKIIIIIITII